MVIVSADAGAYADWAQTPKNLATWIAVPDDINVYGISATLVDMGSSGGLARLEKFCDHGVDHIAMFADVPLDMVASLRP